MNKKNITAVLMIVLSSLVQVFSLLAFVRPMGMLPSGFTGLATLINMMLERINISISVSNLILLLNFPVAIFCYKKISKRFVILSCLQFSLVSLFLHIPITPVIDDFLLGAVFGGVLTGISVVIALKVDASSGGTDFISMYVSNKLGISIWNYVFMMNVVQYTIFGIISDFHLAGYSMIMNLIITSTISKLYYRYNQTTLQITTSKPNEIIEGYTKKYRHGISIINAKGGYSKKEMSMLHTVVSNAEVSAVVMSIQEIDNDVIINSFKTERFYGKFYRPPIA